MERIKTLLARYRQTAFLFFAGLALIVDIALGVLYFQQAPERRTLQAQINTLNVLLRNPLPDPKTLEAELEPINLALTPIADNVSIAMLLDIARKNGIDISEQSGKFSVPIASHSSSGTFQLQSFRGIQMQGDPEAVMAFIRLLDSDEMLTPPGSSAPRTVVRAVTRVAIEDNIEVTPGDKEAERRAEFRGIIDAVKRMMSDNRIIRLPHPLSISLGRASNRMGDDPNTPTLLDGFPDVTTTAAEKGYTGNATPRNGYLLWEHDKINSDNTTRYTTTNYTQTLNTTYYYTAEEDGTVRQWSSFNVFSSTEYTDSGPTKLELKANLDIDFYFKTE
ncbi:MAG: hypothetical protein HYX80_06790 [Chloroflexi bacterium]|nr:hypothetical protein [Chloroflexota bacterium]